MKEFLTRNLGWKLLSLAMAVALWIAVAREPELATSLSVPIQFKNMPDDLDFVSNVPDKVQLEVRGQSGRISRTDLADVGIILDLKEARAGERTYTIQPSNAKLPSGVSFQRAIPSQITMRFERLVSREVRIHPLYVKTPDGYRIRGEVIDPPKVRLRGPEDRLKNMEQVMTDPVDLTGVVSQREFHTHVNAGDPQIRLESAPVVTLKVTLEKITSKDAR
jgi:YbbR domain-containing protein